MLLNRITKLNLIQRCNEGVQGAGVEQERSRRTRLIEGGVNDRPVMAGEQLHAKRGTAMVER
jgi:hypothetical protein